MQDLKVTIVQADLFWEDREKNLEHFDNLLSPVRETHLIVLPEMFSTGFSMEAKQLAENMHGISVSWMRTKAKEKNAVITGSLIISDNGNYYNRLIWMHPNGMLEYYDKRHTFSLAGEDKYYAHGESKIFPEVEEWKVLPLICYDLRFPVWSRQSPPYTEHGIHPYHLLIYSANWPERRIYAWQQLLRARAIENQCYVVGVNRVGNDGNGIYHSGHSAVIDPMGEPELEIAIDEKVETITLNAQHLLSIREKLPFLNDRDEFELRR
ncbi:MAG: amidohydrolase [Chitinophagales bacterium]